MRSEVIERLELIQREISIMLTQLKAPAVQGPGGQAPERTPPPPAPPEPSGWEPSVAPRGAALLQNPYVGRVQSVTQKQIPLKKGGFGIIYEIHTGAAKFETWDDKLATLADKALAAGQVVNIKWKERQNGKYTNYDAMSLGIQAVARV